MRAINLTMQAFGPFKDKVNIDFEKFGKNGLFLITGATGAGKTTIFDAISYALFGQSSGGDRSESMLRFSAAGPELETYVEFIFEYKGQTYKIRRSPRYERLKSRGEGTTGEGTKQTILYLPDGSSINSLTDADQYIVNMLGVDADQFTQIAMLAQGDFVKLLKADNEEKRKLFRRLFSTGKFIELEKNIKEKFRKSREELEINRALYDEILKGFELLDNDSEKFSELIAGDPSFIIDFIENINQDFANRLANIELENVKITKEKEETSKLMDKVSDYIDNKSKLEENIKRLESIKENFESLTSKHDNLSKDEERRDEILAKIGKLEEELKKFENINMIIADINTKSAELDILKSDKIKNDNQKERIGKEIISINKFLDENEKLDLDFTQLIVKKDKLKAVIAEYDSLINLYVDQEKYESERSEFEEKYHFYKKIKKAFEDKITEMENYYFESQAGILAKDLKEGQACPVCGSIHHPDPARLKNENISKEEIEKEKERASSNLEVFEKVKDSLLKKNEKLTFISDEISKFYKKYPDLPKEVDQVKVKKASLTDQVSDIENKLDDLDKTFTLVETAKENLRTMLEEEANFREKGNTLSNQIIVLETNLNNLKEQEEKERSTLGDRGDKLILAEKDNLMQDKKYLEGYISKIREVYSKTRTEITRIESENKLYSSKLDDSYNLDIASLESKIFDIDSELSKLKKEELLLRPALSTNISHLHRFKEQIKLIKEREHSHNNYKQLADILSGNISGMNVVSFETFVQMKYLDRILIESNKRLQKMTEGRYSLIRKTSESKKKQSGLDFYVIDHHNKKERDINTLSGGESFQAALSLALGLSDIIQMESGGVELNSMFVDEGFGTLDGDTLSKVMATLLSISKVDKLIGIISHVDTLKDQIDKKIVIDRSRDGHSTISQEIF